MIIKYLNVVSDLSENFRLEKLLQKVTTKYFNKKYFNELQDIFEMVEADNDDGYEDLERSGVVTKLLPKDVEQLFTDNDGVRLQLDNFGGISLNFALTDCLMDEDDSLLIDSLAFLERNFMTLEKVINDLGEVTLFYERIIVAV
jgi:hypothetical protein